MSRCKILFQLTGSIAGFKAVQLISLLLKSGHEIQTVATSSALQFVGPATLEGLTGRAVLTDSFEPGKMMGHIDWARWADLLILCPATARTINELASGTATGIIGDLYLANNFLKPYMVVPAMNSQMYLHPATQKSLSQLQSWGCTVLNSATGELACGEYGEGRMLEPQDIMKTMDRILLDTSSKKKILITAGGTREPIDGVRHITNFSSGETGRILAEYLNQRGYEVYFLRSSTATTPHGLKNIFTYETSDDLESLIKKLVSEHEFQYVIQAAAVSDYQLESINDLPPDIEQKLDSEASLTLKLKKRSKIIDQIKSFSKNPNIKVIGFKLTQSNDKKADHARVLKLSMNPNVDFVVHNEISTTRGNSHHAHVYKKDIIISETESKLQLAENIEKIIQEGP